jgi:hypothetical protein
MHEENIFLSKKISDLEAKLRDASIFAMLYEIAKKELDEKIT